MFFSHDPQSQERVPLTRQFNRSRNEDNQNEKPVVEKDYTPIIHSPFGSKKKRPPVIHSPPAAPKPIPPKPDPPKPNPPRTEKKKMLFKKKSPSNIEIKEDLKVLEAPKPSVPTHVDGTPLRSSEVALLEGLICKWKNYSNKRKTDEGSDQYRKGPAPLDDHDGSGTKKKFIIRCSHGTLDSDVESDDETDGKKKQGASCKSLILYFAKLAVSSNERESIDLKFVESLIKGGANINATDRTGQTILHEVSRAWHTDVAKFLLDKGASINKGDKFGRTPLHLSAAVGYVEMVEFLIANGANINCKTTGEDQTPIHYAARNNAVATLKILIRFGASITDRDYKSRTPLYIAAENGRTEAARMLLDAGAPAAVYDDEGISCLTLMIEKMPAIAGEALEQFCTEDRALRKTFYYLNYLEKKLSTEDNEETQLRHLRKSEREKRRKQMAEERKKNRKDKKEKLKSELARSPLEAIVEFRELELIMHPAVITLIEKKWELFGKRHSQTSVLANLVYAIIWSICGTLLPDQKTFYTPISKWWWIILLEVVGVMMTIYFMAKQIIEARTEINREKAYKSWHIEQTERDLGYCHPQWPEERRYLDAELERLRRGKSGKYFSDGWVVIDWLIHLAVWVIVFTRIAAVVTDNDSLKVNHIRIFAVSLLFIWLRILSSCRAFQSVGPFITLLGHVVDDTTKFAFLFFEFFIPYTCAFWMLFGGKEKAQQAGDSVWVKINDLIFSVYQMTLIENIKWEMMYGIDTFMAQILVGSYIALSSIVCLNLYIALMSDTFARVYQNAKANAILEQAAQILKAQRSLSKKHKIDMLLVIHEQCAPLQVYASDDISKNKQNPGDRVYDLVNRHTDLKMEDLKEQIETISKEIKSSNKSIDSRVRSKSTVSISNWQDNIEKKITGVNSSLEKLEKGQAEIFQFIKDNFQSDDEDK